LKGRNAPVGEAARLVREASAQKNANALLLHAAMAAIGLGRPQNYDDALGYVREAAALGDTRARGQLAALGENFKVAAWFAPARPVQHAGAPRIFTVENFLPPSVCEWLMRSAKKRLVRALINDASTGAIGQNQVRTGSVFESSSVEPDLVHQLVNQRIAEALGIPLAHQEPTNILHYARSQEYKPHYDVILPGPEADLFARELNDLGQRTATFLVYLNEDYEGGETHFPRLGFRYKGKPGDALIFWNLSETGEVERNSLHAGMPVTKGEKWLLSKWIRQKPLPLF
jgi:predicted 2-oxoglutarate/Fe(II)-dependent dioxygenase YbiX